MAVGVHNFTDLVNVQTNLAKICNFIRLLYSRKIAACTKHNCGCNGLKIILLKNLFEFIVLVSSVRVKDLPEIFLFRFIPFVYLQKVHICMSHSQQINYIIYSVREKTCTAPDRFVYFLDYHCIRQQVISSFILYANQTDTRRFVHTIFCDFACF